jgi:hypothetical protein
MNGVAPVIISAMRRPVTGLNVSPQWAWRERPTHLPAAKHDVQLFCHCSPREATLHSGIISAVRTGHPPHIPNIAKLVHTRRGSRLHCGTRLQRDLFRRRLPDGKAPTSAIHQGKRRSLACFFARMGLLPLFPVRGRRSPQLAQDPQGRRSSDWNRRPELLSRMPGSWSGMRIPPDTRLAGSVPVSKSGVHPRPEMKCILTLMPSYEGQRTYASAQTVRTYGCSRSSRSPKKCLPSGPST